MKVILTEAAYADLYHIGKTIKQDSPRRAGTFVAELYDKCHRLGDMPLAVPLVPNREDNGVRRRVHGKYLIFYRIEGETLEVLHVLHGATDYEKVLFGGE